jgi:predicted N-acetyltransferase YhbS
LEKLLKNTFPGFRKDNLWFWKYRLNPSFDNSLVAIAEEDGKLIGSNYWLLRDLKVSSKTHVKAVLGADVAVDPDYRGQGIGTELIRFLRLSGAFKEKGILLSYVFGRPELNKRFYIPAAGYMFAPDGTTTYRRFFNCQELIGNFQKIDRAIRSNEAIRKQLKPLVMCISFKLKGAPEFSVHIEEDKVYLEEGKAENSDVLIEGHLPLSLLIVEGSVNVGDLVRSWIIGEIKIRKGISHIFKLRKAFMLFRLALKANSQNHGTEHNTV